MEAKITHNSMISVGLAVTLAVVIFSAGILKTRVDTNIEEMKEFKTDTKQQFVTLNEKIDRLMSLKIASYPLGANQGME